MKIRPSVILLVVITAMLIVWLFWSGRERQVSIPQANSTKITSLAQPTVTAPNLPSPSTLVHTNMPVAHLAKGADLSETPPLSKAERATGILSAYNDVPIDFYGKLEDQFSNAVSDATVNFGVRIINGYEATVTNGQAVSDANGFFTITGYHGQDLSVVPQKAGYVLTIASTLFKYSHMEDRPFASDPDNPIVIKMWKLQGAEHLISFRIEKYIPVDGTPVSLDLQTGQQVASGGDLTIRLQSVTKPSVRAEYDWQVSMQMVDGGIIQDSSGLGLQKMFQAPDSGYEPEFDLSFQKNTRQWTPRFNDDFYFTSQGSKCYGKLWLEVDTDVVRNGTALVTLKGYLNPSGSRNLESEP